ALRPNDTTPQSNDLRSTSPMWRRRPLLCRPGRALYRSNPAAFWGIPDALATASARRPSAVFWFSSAARGRIEALKSIKCRFLHLFNIGLGRLQNEICNTAISNLNFFRNFLENWRGAVGVCTRTVLNEGWDRRPRLDRKIYRLSQVTDVKRWTGDNPPSPHWVAPA